MSLEDEGITDRLRRGALIDVDADAAILTAQCEQWIATSDLVRTMSARGREWTPARTGAALRMALGDGRLELAVDSNGHQTVPNRVRRTIRRPGEVEPSEGPRAMTTEAP